jgi:hypothetical protein
LKEDEEDSGPSCSTTPAMLLPKTKGNLSEMKRP